MNKLAPQKNARFLARAKSILRLTLLLACVSATAHAKTETKRPNIIFILTDDHRWDAMGFTGTYPFLKTPNLDRMRYEGAHIKNAFATLSMCSPSRASYLTGLYPHTHGVSNNNEHRECDWAKTPSFGQYLQDAGYNTGYIGKVHLAEHNDPRPGFDYWVSFTGQGNYNGNHLGVNGKEVFEPGYVTDVLTRYATNFIKQERGDKPFMLYLSHKAVHQPFTPAKRHKNLYPNARFKKPETLQEDRTNKPNWQRSVEWFDTVFVNDKLTYSTPNNRLMEWDETKGFIGRSKPYLQSFAAVDESIGTIMDLLKERGELDNTFIVYAGDNGYLFGEHGRSDKRVAYNESIRVPMVIRYPKLIKPNTTIEDYVLNVDLAPTLLELASVPSPGTMHGKSMLPLFAGNNDGWREGFLYNYNWDLHPLIPTIVAYRSPEFLYSTTPTRNDLDELYDLTRDPLETTNQINNPEYEQKKKELMAKLEQAKKEVNFTLTVPDPSVGRWHAPEEVTRTYEVPQEKQQFTGKSSVTLPQEMNLNLQLGTVSMELDFTPESDGMVFNQYKVRPIHPGYTELYGFLLYVDQGKVNLCYQCRQVSYILRDDQDVTGKPVNVKFSLSSDGKLITLQVNGGKVWTSTFTDSIRALNEKPYATLGKCPGQLSKRVPAKNGFKGSVSKITVSQTKQ